jgi:hypothetical protein
MGWRLRALMALAGWALFAALLPGAGFEGGAGDGERLPAGEYLQEVGMLDSFNRANGGIGGSWSGNLAGFAILNNRLDVVSGGEIYWAASRFGADQELAITLANVTPNTKEILLLLKVQSTSTHTSGVIEVWLDPANQRLSIFTYNGGWIQHGGYIPMTYANGDQWRVAARANGQVEVYKNGKLEASRSTAGYPYTNSGGYLGLWLIDANQVLLDDFGGGNMGSPPALPVRMYLPGIIR